MKLPAVSLLVLTFVGWAACQEAKKPARVDCQKLCKRNFEECFGLFIIFCGDGLECLLGQLHVRCFFGCGRAAYQ